MKRKPTPRRRTKPARRASERAKPPSAASPGDSLKALMPAGEAGPRNPVAPRPASESGGASGAEDTTRAAGYVVDFLAVNEPPPGPPVSRDPAQLALPDARPAPPRPRAPAVPPRPPPPGRHARPRGRR